LSTQELPHAFAGRGRARCAQDGPADCANFGPACSVTATRRSCADRSRVGRNCPRTPSGRGALALDGERRAVCHPSTRCTGATVQRFGVLFVLAHRPHAGQSHPAGSGRRSDPAVCRPCAAVQAGRPAGAAVFERIRNQCSNAGVSGRPLFTTGHRHWPISHIRFAEGQGPCAVRSSEPEPRLDADAGRPGHRSQEPRPPRRPECDTRPTVEDLRCNRSAQPHAMARDRSPIVPRRRPPQIEIVGRAAARSRRCIGVDRGGHGHPTQVCRNGRRCS